MARAGKAQTRGVRGKRLSLVGPKRMRDHVNRYVRFLVAAVVGARRVSVFYDFFSGLSVGWSEIVFLRLCSEQFRECLCPISTILYSI